VVTWTLNAEAFLVVLEDYFLAAGLAGGWGLPLSPRSKRILCQQAATAAAGQGGVLDWGWARRGDAARLS